MTAPDRADASARRVSDEQIDWALAKRSDGYAPSYQQLALDLRDARQHAADQDARIAELERELEGARDGEWHATECFREERVRADRLASEAQAAREAGLQDGLREASDVLCNAAIALTIGKYVDHQLARNLEHYAKMIRARLSTEGEKA